MNKILPLLFLSVLPCLADLGLTNVPYTNVLWYTNVVVTHEDGAQELKLTFTLTITTLTNVVSGDNSGGCNMCYDSSGHWNGSIPAVVTLEPCKPYSPATERWTITNVVRRFTIESYNVTVGDEQFTFKRVVDKPISSVTNRLVFKGEWVKP